MIIQKATYKNITVKITADKKSPEYLKMNPNGYFEPVIFDSFYAKREAKSLYESPRNENRRKKQIIEIKLHSSSAAELEHMRKKADQYFEQTAKETGTAKTDGKRNFHTMLKNKHLI